MTQIKRIGADMKDEKSVLIRRIRQIRVLFSYWLAMILHKLRIVGIYGFPRCPARFEDSP
jgi:hypothetical protein